MNKFIDETEHKLLPNKQNYKTETALTLFG